MLAAKKTSCYTDIFAKKMVKLGETHEDVVAITAAMAQEPDWYDLKRRTQSGFSMWELQNSMR